MGLYIVLGCITLILIVLTIYVIKTYNALVVGRNKVNTQWAQIHVQLMRKSELIPNLLEAVQAYVSHEKDIFKHVADARQSLQSALTPSQSIKANEQLTSVLSRLMALAEEYPELKSNANYLDLQANLKESEDKIAYARQFYNDTVLLYSNKLHQFPSNIISKMFHFPAMEYYDITNA